MDAFYMNQLVINSLLRRLGLSIGGNIAIFNDALKLYANAPKMGAHTRLPILIVKLIKHGGFPKEFI
jgi:hypothetical protein